MKKYLQIINLYYESYDLETNTGSDRWAWICRTIKDGREEVEAGVLPLENPLVNQGALWRALKEDTKLNAFIPNQKTWLLVSDQNPKAGYTIRTEVRA